MWNGATSGEAVQSPEVSPSSHTAGTFPCRYREAPKLETDVQIKTCVNVHKSSIHHHEVCSSFPLVAFGAISKKSLTGRWKPGLVACLKQ
jgi:hypothetical protein